MAEHISTSGCFEGVLEDVHEPGRVDAMFDRIDGVKEAVQSISSTVQSKYTTYDERYHFHQKLDDGKQYAKEHPITTLFVLVGLSMCGFPVACFLAFAIGSLFFTLLGCLFVEGFLLTIGSFFLVGSLCLMGFFSLILSSFVLLTWYSFNSGQKLISYTRQQIENKTLRNDPNDTNGECMKDSGTEKEE